MYEVLTVPRFDGGLNFAAHPASIADNEWTWANGFEPRGGCALHMVDAVSHYTGASYITTHKPLSLVARAPNINDPAGVTGNGILVVHTDLTSGFLHAFSADGFATAITVSGTWKAPTSTTLRGLLRPRIGTAVLNNLQILSAGAPGTGESVVAFEGFTPVATVVNPSNTLNAVYLVSSQGYVIAAHCGTSIHAGDYVRVRISDTNDPLTWDPNIGNRSDDFFLTSTSNICGLEATSDGAVLVTEDALHYMRSTGGGDPPFTVTRVAGDGAQKATQWITDTPLGAIAWLGGRFKGLNGAIAGGDKCALYLFNPTVTFPSAFGLFKMVYDRRRNAIIVARPSTAGTDERMFFSPDTGAWWRRTWESSVTDVMDQTMGLTHSTGNSTATTIPWYFYIRDTGDIFVEKTIDPDGSTAGMTGAFVDTKDFAFADPQSTDYIDRIQVDWEPLTGGSDSIKVYAFVREELFPSGYVGTAGLNTDFTSNFTLLGTLDAATRQLSVNLRGRYARFRIETVTGRARIRGLSIRRERGSDRSA